MENPVSTNVWFQMKRCWKPFIENYKDLILNSEKKIYPETVFQPASRLTSKRVEKPILRNYRVPYNQLCEVTFWKNHLSTNPLFPSEVLDIL